MADLGFIESALLPLPLELRPPVMAAFREVVKQMRIGPVVDVETARRSTNLGGHLVPFTTSATVNAEVALPHGLGYAPSIAMPVIPVGVANATVPTLVVTRASDATYVYVKSAVAGATGILYVE